MKFSYLFQPKKEEKTDSVCVVAGKIVCVQVCCSLFVCLFNFTLHAFNILIFDELC